MLIIAILSAITSTLMAQSLFAKGSNNPYDKMRRAALAISALYVDTVDDNKLAEDAIRGMIENLDPHSSYSTAKQARAFNESLGGSFDGIGVQFNIRHLIHDLIGREDHLGEEDVADDEAENAARQTRQQPVEEVLAGNGKAAVAHRLE